MLMHRNSDSVDPWQARLQIESNPANPMRTGGCRDATVFASSRAGS